MEVFFVSTLAIAVGEIGDKTQLLALLLAARFRRPLPIALGILAATVLNHSVAGALGAWAGSWLEPAWLGWGLGLSFISLGIWMLIPDKLDAASDKPIPFGGHQGAFLVTLGSFFLAEIGDKTQIATVVLAARYDSPIAVIGGTTLGMLLADLPAVWLGGAVTTRIPFALVRMAAALLFVAMGAAALVSGVSFSFP